MQHLIRVIYSSILYLPYDKNYLCHWLRSTKMKVHLEWVLDCPTIQRPQMSNKLLYLDRRKQRKMHWSSTKTKPTSSESLSSMPSSPPLCPGWTLSRGSSTWCRSENPHRDSNFCDKVWNDSGCGRMKSKSKRWQLKMVILWHYLKMKEWNTYLGVLYPSFSQKLS